MNTEEELELEPEVEIPSHFLCPISLLLMHDPVTVSTGITYDRPAIQHWLHTKQSKRSPVLCPVTKQPLSSSSELTPNHTLRRLIQSWCTLHSLDRIPTPTLPPPIPNITSLATLLLHPSTSPSSAAQTLSTLSSLNASHDDLNHLLNTKGDAFLSRLTLFLSDSDPHTRLSSIHLLRAVYAAADPIHLTAVKPEIFSAIVSLLRDRDRVPLQACKSGLKLLFEVNPWGRNRVKAVNAGAVEALVEILLDGVEHKRLCELVMGVLDQLCGCAEGRAGLLGHGAGLAVVSKRILRVSSAVSDRAVRVLGSVSKNSANAGVLAEMLKVGVVAKLCLVVQVECGLKTKERAKEILRAHSRVWRSSPCIPPHLLRSYPS